jgi:hypothetical protein
MTLDIAWLDHGREPQCKPDPSFPTGVDVDLSRGADVTHVTTCSAQLPYPARRCGMYIIKCKLCGLCVTLTTAGRPDDPRSIKLACRLESAG